jgi:hypothetical protein
MQVLDPWSGERVRVPDDDLTTAFPLKTVTVTQLVSDGNGYVGAHIKPYWTSHVTVYDNGAATGNWTLDANHNVADFAYLQTLGTRYRCVSMGIQYDSSCDRDASAGLGYAGNLTDDPAGINCVALMSFFTRRVGVIGSGQRVIWKPDSLSPEWHAAADTYTADLEEKALFIGFVGRDVTTNTGYLTVTAHWEIAPLAAYRHYYNAGAEPPHAPALRQVGRVLSLPDNKYDHFHDPAAQSTPWYKKMFMKIGEDVEAITMSAADRLMDRFLGPGSVRQQLRIGSRPTLALDDVD